MCIQVRYESILEADSDRSQNGAFEDKPEKFMKEPKKLTHKQHTISAPALASAQLCTIETFCTTAPHHIIAYPPSPQCIHTLHSSLSAPLPSPPSTLPYREIKPRSLRQSKQKEAAFNSPFLSSFIIRTKPTRDMRGAYVAE